MLLRTSCHNIFMRILYLEKKLQMYLFLQSFPRILISCRHSLQDILDTFGPSLHKKHLNFFFLIAFTKAFLVKVHIDLALIFQPQIVFDISVLFHFRIILIRLLSPYAQHMQIWVFFDPILAIIT